MFGVGVSIVDELCNCFGEAIGLFDEAVDATGWAVLFNNEPLTAVDDCGVPPAAIATR